MPTSSSLLTLSIDDPIVEIICRHAPHAFHIHRTNLERTRYFRAVICLLVPIINQPMKSLTWFATTYLAYQRQADKGSANKSPFNRKFNALLRDAQRKSTTEVA